MKKLYLIGLMIFLIISSTFIVFADDTKTVTVTMLATSDLHGRIYPHDYATDSVDNSAGFAKIQTLVLQEKAKNENTVLMDCGDTTQDNLAELFNNEPIHPMVKALNYMKYDAWTLGNHEFNFGLDFLNKNIAGFKGKILAANIYKADGSRFVNPYVIIEKSGIRIAVVGLMPPHVPTWEASTPANFKGLTFTDPVAEAKKVVAELKGKYDVLIGAFHLGDTTEYTATDGAIPVAEACPEFSVIFCGHKHAYFDNITKNGVKLVETGFNGKALGKADIKLAKNADKWEIKEVVTKNLDITKITADPKMLDEFKAVHDTSLTETNKIVGQISADFIKRPDYITGADEITTIPTSQIIDTAVIDLINDVQMFYTNAEISSAALFNFGSNLKQGPFKKKDVSFIYKYTNTLMGVNITGASLKKYMEWSASYYNSANDGDVTISFNPNIRGYNYDMFSGVNYQIDLRQPVGSRITNLTFKGKPIQDDKIYKLAVNNYRFGTLLSLKLIKPEDKYYDSYDKYQDAGRVRDLIIKYVQEQKKGKIDPTVDNNWKIIGFDFTNPYQEPVFELVRQGKLKIPASEDGRTLNVKSLNINDLLAAGTIKVTKYTVKSGDVLWKIAAAYKTAIDQLIKWNQLKKPGQLLPGQELIVGFEY